MRIDSLLSDMAKDWGAIARNEFRVADSHAPGTIKRSKHNCCGMLLFNCAEELKTALTTAREERLVTELTGLAAQWLNSGRVKLRDAYFESETDVEKGKALKYVGLRNIRCAEELTAVLNYRVLSLSIALLIDRK